VKLEKSFQPSIISGSKASLSKLDHLSKESPGLIFASKADAYLSEAHLGVALLASVLAG
jgi:hypothetical protein